MNGRKIIVFLTLLLVLLAQSLIVVLHSNKAKNDSNQLTCKGNNHPYATNLTIVGYVKDDIKLPGPAKMYISGDYAYVALEGGGGICIIDISDPSVPTITGYLRNDSYLGGADGIFVRENYVYVACCNVNRMTVVDITNKAAPVIKSSVKDDVKLHAPENLYVAGNYAYVMNILGDSMTIVDISNPLSPVVKGTVADSRLNGASGIYVVGDYAYAVAREGDNFCIIDVANKNAPVIIGYLSTPGLTRGGNGVWISDRYAYTCSWFEHKLNVIDITDVHNPVLVGSVTDNVNLYNAYTLQVIGKYAFVAAHSDRLTVVDITNPANPTVVDTIQDHTKMNYATNLGIKGGYAYVISFIGNSLASVNVSHYIHYKNRSPIHINGNGEFIPANGVTAGIGTYLDPYTIDWWDITADTADGIWIENTTKDFIISNCYVHGGNSTWKDGIRLNNVKNGVVEKVNATENSNGIQIFESRNNTIYSCTLNNNNHGLCLKDSWKNTITGNYFGFDTNGIRLVRSPYNTVGKNSFSSCGLTMDGNIIGHYLQTYPFTNVVNDKPLLQYSNTTGPILNGVNAGQIIMVNCDEAVLTQINISHTDTAVLVVNSTHVKITNCTFTGNSYGIELRGTEISRIFHNNFVDNTNPAQAYDDTNKSFWNSTGEGNWWNDWTSPDSDWNGIVDLPYNISGGVDACDYYPLTAPVYSKPSSPQLLSPIHGNRTIGNSVNLSWNRSIGSGVITYDVYFGTFTPPTTTIATDLNKTWVKSTTNDGAVYYWFVRAKNLNGSADSAIWSFRENALPPVPISPISPVNGAQDVPYNNVQVTWTSGGYDPDSDNISYEWYIDTDNPPAYPYTANGTTNWTDSAEFTIQSNTTYYWWVRAFDGYEWSSYSNNSHPWEFKTKENITPPIDNPPKVVIFVPNGSEIWDQDTIHLIKWNATDDKSLSSTCINISYSENNGTSWTIIGYEQENNGTFAWKPPDNVNSTQCLVKIECTDSAMQTTIDWSNKTFTIREVVIPVDNPPEIYLLAPKMLDTLYGGDFYTIKWNATDDKVLPSKCVNISYTLDNGNNWTAIATNHNNSGSIQWIVPRNDTTEARVSVTIYDSKGQMATDTSGKFTIEKWNKSADTKPVITSTPNKTATVGQEWTYKMIVTDAEIQWGDYLKFTLDKSPQGMEINETSGLITWTPDTAGNYTATVVVTDSQGLFANQTFTITITAGPEDEVPIDFAMLMLGVFFFVIFIIGSIVIIVYRRKRKTEVKTTKGGEKEDDAVRQKVYDYVASHPDDDFESISAALVMKGKELDDKLQFFTGSGMMEERRDGKQRRFIVIDREKTQPITPTKKEATPPTPIEKEPIAAKPEIPPASAEKPESPPPSSEKPESQGLAEAKVEQTETAPKAIPAQIPSKVKEEKEEDEEGPIKDGFSLSDEIEMLLYRNKRYIDEVEVPYFMTQKGMCEHFKVGQNTLSKTLARKVKRGYMKKVSKHIIKKWRKMDAYFLTHEGERDAVELYKKKEEMERKKEEKKK